MQRVPFPSPFRSVLLDLDGCLVDSNDAHARSWVDALARFGHRVAFGRIRWQIGKSGSEIVRDLVSPAERHFLTDALGETATSLYMRRFTRSVAPLPGAAATVRAMRRAGLPVVLASSAERGVVERSLRLLKLRDVVTGFTCADDVKKAKPFPDVFALAIRRFRLEEKEPVAIGDTPYDIGAAHQIGVACLALESGGFPRSTLAACDGLFADMPDLWARGRGLFAA